MTDIVRLVQLDHQIARRQFDDLYLARVTASPAELAAAWRALAALLRIHLDATGRLLGADHVVVDDERRAEVATIAGRVLLDLDQVEQERSGTDVWWASVAAVRRSVTEVVAVSDETLIALLRAALDDGQRDDLGRLWLDEHPSRQ